MAAWSLAFRDRVGDVMDGGLTVDLSMKAPLLDEMAALLEANPRSDGDAKPLQESMLALWVLLLSHVDKISVLKYKYMCYRLLEALVQRDEFLLLHLDFDFNTMDVRKDGDRDAWRLVHLYRKLVGDTFVHASSLLLRNTLSIELQRFCALVATRAYFVFPLLQAPFVDICNRRYCQHKPLRPTTLHEMLQAQRRAHLAKCTDTTFMDACPDLFHWGWLAKDTDAASLLPDDSPWRLVLASDGSLFVLFVQAFNACVASVTHRAGVHAPNWSMVPGYLDLMQLFALVVFDTTVWLSHVPSVGELTTSAMFPMTFSLVDQVLEGASRSMANPGMVQVLLPTVVVGLQQHTSWHPAGLTRSLRAISRWIHMASQPYVNSSAGGGNQSESSTTLQSLHLYPSFVPLGAMIPLLLQWLASKDDSVALPALLWVDAHLQHMPTDAKEQLVSTILHPKLFYNLFLHWSPHVRTAMHYLLTYQLYRHDRRHLQLHSDAALLLEHAHDVVKPDARSLAKVSESPNFMLDISSASKMETHVFVLTSPIVGVPPFPEALSIFVEVSLAEYAAMLTQYYVACDAAEASLGRRLYSDEVVAGPDIQHCLALCSTQI
ncbi:hypothetical protein SDRG_07462 [Saprolegnia diclina VS20]|uniref:Uncharacterized protein n=1 Tax=Saprolegnia diclina (strain VS20) TaxID=1156394 RepID=T0QBE6_SAPDV|nr:hypothetical protein SDRG_07462 [Saprolegnia diclina VS20]EQC35234.1 hypothetical protein SDRG_07462 [Saprolegnia diclina VS20]|eukprot:XP_008611518.1 hypothetical protein SDRG_07462 [Saprolegnia diclina VS20]